MVNWWQIRFRFGQAREYREVIQGLSLNNMFDPFIKDLMERYTENH